MVYSVAAVKLHRPQASSSGSAAVTRKDVLIGGVAGLVGGAMSMAAASMFPSARNPTQSGLISRANVKSSARTLALN